MVLDRSLSENKCPKCLFMKLDLKEELDYFKLHGPQGELIIKKPETKIHLHLTINFNEQWEELVFGRVKFGLKGGELSIKLNNGIMPYDQREIYRPLEVYVEKTREVSRKNSNWKSIKLKASKIPAEAEIGGNETSKVSNKFRFVSCQVSTKGSVENPVWEFKVETEEPVLKGTLKRSLGTIIRQDTEKSCCLDATFEVSLKDVCLTETEAPWCVNIVPEKRAVIDRAIAKFFLKNKFKPYISRETLQYD